MLGLLPFPRMALGSSFDSSTLTEEEMSLLLVAMVKDYVQMKATVLEQETEDFRSVSAPLPEYGLPSPLEYQEGMRVCMHMHTHTHR